MTRLFDSTIAAIATPHGTGGIAVIRLSGPDSWSIAQVLSKQNAAWEPGKVIHAWITDPRDQQMVDHVLLLPFKAPKSYTGEDCIEIHCHGGYVLTQTVLNLCLQAGAQAAEAGAFTKRALLHGQIDLTQAESILDLIHAEGEALIKLAANNLRHRSVGMLLENYVQNIATIQADLIASIDFPDEVEEPDRNVLGQQLNQLSTTLSDYLLQHQVAQSIREGVQVVLVGRPNAGKSALFNALLHSERAIVTEIAGTTRDVLRETLSLHGIPVTLIDTAGLRETDDRVEVLGVEKTWQAISTAQALLYVVDGTQPLTEEDKTCLEKLQAQHGLILINKSDQPNCKTSKEAFTPFTSWQSLQVSANTGGGISEIYTWLKDFVLPHPDNTGLNALLSQRQLTHLHVVQTELSLASETLLTLAIPIDLATVPLTNALLELQALLGQDTSEQVLDSVFERFCVGK